MDSGVSVLSAELGLVSSVEPTEVLNVDEANKVVLGESGWAMVVDVEESSIEEVVRP